MDYGFYFSALHYKIHFYGEIKLRQKTLGIMANNRMFIIYVNDQQNKRLNFDDQSSTVHVFQFNEIICFMFYFFCWFDIKQVASNICLRTFKIRGVIVSGVATGGSRGTECPLDSEKFAKKFAGKKGKKSGKRGKIGKFLSFCPSWQIGLATLLVIVLCVIRILQKRFEIVYEILL